MEINIRPAMPEERKYAYTPSMDIIARTRCIGHLRGDMDTYGNGCYTSWDDHNRSLKTDEFKQRFDDVIEALRHDEAYGGILKNRRSLEQYCQAHPEAKYSDEFRTYYIFRADEGDYAYLLRCDYREGVYNVYIYAYERLGLEQHMEKARNGIRFVDSDYREAFTLPDGDKLKIVSRDGESVERICRYIDPMHFELGDVVFHIHEFAERMSEMGKQIIPLRSSLPEHCYSFLQSSSEIILISRGEKGYHPTFVQFDDRDEARRYVDKANELDGVSKSQEAAMLAGSMFGWHTPSADPKNYEDSGRALRPIKQDRER